MPAEGTMALCPWRLATGAPVLVRRLFPLVFRSRQFGTSCSRMHSRRCLRIGSTLPRLRGAMSQVLIAVSAPGHAPWFLADVSDVLLATLSFRLDGA